MTSGGVEGGILELQVTLKLASFVKTTKDFLEKFEENSFHHRRYTRSITLKCVTSGWIHLRRLTCRQYSTEGTPQP